MIHKIYLLFIFFGFVSSAQVNWISNSGGDWYDASNWNIGVPTANDDVVIAINTSFVVVLQDANPVTVKSLTLGLNSCTTCTDTDRCRNELLLKANLIVNGPFVVESRGAIMTDEPVQITSPQEMVFNGSINIGGTINGNVHCVDLCVLNPRSSSGYASLSINGNLEMSGFILYFDVAGYDQGLNADFIQVSGSFQLDATIWINFIFPFTPELDDIFVLWDSGTANLIGYRYVTAMDSAPALQYNGCGSAGVVGSNDDCKDTVGGQFAVVISPDYLPCCPVGYTGDNCDVPNCAGNPDCYGHGICEDNYPDLPTCSCFTGWKGNACTFNDCPGTPDCNNRGTCNSTSQCTCKNGWTGADCSTPVCPEQCNGNGECSSLYDPPKCECNTGWGGPTCSQNLTVVNCQNDCSGRGTCNDKTGVCTCDDRWSGNDCSIPICSPQCSPYGACIYSSIGIRCYCEQGWEGETCSVPVCPGTPQCSSKGTCSGAFNPPVCTCDSGWGGEDCSINLSVIRCQKNCSSHGTCDSQTGRCTCDSGWTDNSCSTAVCDGSTTCNYHGICNSTGAGTNKCFCNSGWTGSQCETPVCQNSCSNNGNCLSTVDPPKCDCKVGFGGSDCSTTLTAGTCPENCSGRGTCNNGVCSCPAAFTGAGCSIPICKNTTSCSFHGQCKVGSPNYCSCDPNWTGDDCSTPKCAGTPECNGNGDCVGYTDTPFCDCDIGFGEETCNFNLTDITCYNDCSNHGTCVKGTCTCERGWAGQWCSTALCNNGDQLCSLHGTCTSQANGTNLCVCDSGWSGISCDIAVCPGKPACNDHGKCISANGGVKCECNIGWGGSDCSNDLTGTACSNNCTSRGDCINGKCQCYANYTGFDCSATECSTNVLCYNGNCSPDGKLCVCYSGYGLDDCSKAICMNDCSGTGTCTVVNGEAICDCEFGKGGEDCSQDIKEGKENSSGVPTGLIIGVVVGGVAVVIIGMVVVTIIIKRRNKAIEKDLNFELHNTN